MDSEQKPGGSGLVENPSTLAEMRKNGVMVGARPVTEDRAGLDELYRLRDEAHATGDWELLRTTVDFPIWMVSDTSDSEAVSYSGEEEEFVSAARESMKRVPKGRVVDHDRTYLFITDALAVNFEKNTVRVGEEQVSFRAAHLVVKTADGRWKVKCVVEGGWGDLAKKMGNPFRMFSEKKD